MHYGFRIVEDMIDGLNDYLDAQGHQESVDRARRQGRAAFDKWEHLDLNYKRVARIDYEKCIGCNLCYIACEDGAHQCIDLGRRPNGHGLGPGRVPGKPIPQGPRGRLRGLQPLLDRLPRGRLHHDDAGGHRPRGDVVARLPGARSPGGDAADPAASLRAVSGCGRGRRSTLVRLDQDSKDALDARVCRTSLRAGSTTRSQARMADPAARKEFISRTLRAEVPLTGLSVTIRDLVAGTFPLFPVSARYLESVVHAAPRRGCRRHGHDSPRLPDPPSDFSRCVSSNGRDGHPRARRPGGTHRWGGDRHVTDRSTPCRDRGRLARHLAGEREKRCSSAAKTRCGSTT